MTEGDLIIEGAGLITAPTEWSFYDLETGLFTGGTFGGIEEFVAANTPPGCGARAGTHDYLSRRVDLETGEIVDWQPPKPAGDEFTDHEWDGGIRRWTAHPTLAGVKRSVVTRLKRRRDTLLEGGFEWDGSRFDSDAAVSQPRLLGLFTSAALGLLPPEGQPWRLADNSWRVLSSMDAQQVWGAFQAHMAGLFAAFAAHEAQVLPQTDIEVLRAYDTQAGWP